MQRYNKIRLRKWMIPLHCLLPLGRLRQNIEDELHRKTNFPATVEPCMNAPSFDTHSISCPICHRPGITPPHKVITGLLTCHHCRARFVVSWSGHYVRDPFTLKHLTAERTLRRNSHPLYRILRDVRFTRFTLILALFAGTVLLGMSGLLSNKLTIAPNSQANPAAASNKPLPGSSL